MKVAQCSRPTKLIATQTDDDAERFIAIGDETERVTTFGNIKFDVEIPQSIIDQGLQIKSDLFAGREEIANGVLSQVAAIQRQTKEDIVHSILTL